MCLREICEPLAEVWRELTKQDIGTGLTGSDWMLVDTCGWIEWLTDGPLADRFGEALLQPDALVIPTSVQFELYKWVRRERGEAQALEVVALTEQGKVIPLTTSIALIAGDFALDFKLSFADAIIYATGRHTGARILTCDDHFQGLEGVQFLPKNG